MKKFTFIVGLFFLVFGLMAFQNAIDNIIALENYARDAQAGLLPDGGIVLDERETIDALRRGDAILQVTRALLVFGFVTFIYSIVDEMKKIKTKLLRQSI